MSQDQPAQPGDTGAVRETDSAPNPFLRYSDEALVDALVRWAADQRERQAWGDRDAHTYRYCAGLLEAAAQRIARSL